jgi:hypothetical protein
MMEGRHFVYSLQHNNYLWDSFVRFVQTYPEVFKHIMSRTSSRDQGALRQTCPFLRVAMNGLVSGVKLQSDSFNTTSALTVDLGNVFPNASAMTLALTNVEAPAEVAMWLEHQLLTSSPKLLTNNVKQMSLQLRESAAKHTVVESKLVELISRCGLGIFQSSATTGLFHL